MSSPSRLRVGKTWWGRGRRFQVSHEVWKQEVPRLVSNVDMPEEAPSLDREELIGSHLHVNVVVPGYSNHLVMRRGWENVCGISALDVLLERAESAHVG